MPENFHSYSDYPSSHFTYSPGLTTTDTSRVDKSERKSMSVSDRVADWFKRPLNSFKEEDSLVALIVCLPLIEKWVKFKLREKGKGDQGGFKCDDPAKNPLCIELAKFLGRIHPKEAFLFYDIVRNGLLHRAMPNPGLDLRLSPETNGISEPVTYTNNPEIMTVYVWVLRNKVVSEILGAGNKLWTKDEVPFLDILNK